MLREVTGKDEIECNILNDCDIPELENLRLVNWDLKNLSSDDKVWQEKASEIGCPIEAGGLEGSGRKQVIKYIVDLRQKVNELFIEKLNVPFPKKGIPTIDEIKAFKRAIASQDLDDLSRMLPKKQQIGYSLLKQEDALSDKVLNSAKIIAAPLICLVMLYSGVKAVGIVGKVLFGMEKGYNSAVLNFILAGTLIGRCLSIIREKKLGRRTSDLESFVFICVASLGVSLTFPYTGVRDAWIASTVVGMAGGVAIGGIIDQKIAIIERAAKKAIRYVAYRFFSIGPIH
ncbi:MAG: hypothetical protein K940chlam6_01615 [Chlamydiae bacterium]|nr:hypothetical protein [Chlamydiota bacterium]